MNNKISYQAMYDKAVFMQPYLYYYITYNICPNRLGIKRIDKNKLYNLLVEKYALAEDKIIRSQSYDHDNNELKHNYVLFDIGNYCMIFFNAHWGCNSYEKLVEIVYSGSTNSDFLKEAEALVKSCIMKEEAQAEIHLITKSDSLSLTWFEIPKVEVDLSLNYNDDFMEIDTLIKARLNKPKDKGIVLLHGLPGTGKTNYIRHLLTAVDKDMIYLPPDLAYEIGSPGFLTFLADHPDSVLIIEDAENVIMERSVGANGAISNLLNLCDGLLADCLNIQVICSFNTDISRVDSALLRKGRLIARYEFRRLTADKAQRLSDSLGFSSIITREMSLSEVYNQDQKEFSRPKPAPIGFGSKIVA